MMIDQETRVEQARWLLDRMHAAIAATDAKVAVSVGLDTGMLGGLAAAYAVARSAAATPSTLIAISLAVLTLSIAIMCAAMAAVPRTKGTSESVVYFGAIAKQGKSDFVARFATIDEADLLTDLCTQIHRNAEIAASKNWWIRQGLIWSFVATIPWLVSLAMLVR